MTKLRLPDPGFGKAAFALAELNFHRSGKYPDWWTGRRFDKPPRFWVIEPSGPVHSIIADRNNV
jgi:hypothetical protein